MGTKRYYSKVTGGRYIFKDGTDVVFAHGFADVISLDHQAELDEILGVNPMIYVQEKLPEPLPQVPQNAVAAADVAAADAALAGRNTRTAQEVGPVTVGATTPSDVNTSTVDPELKAELLNAASNANSPAEMAKRAAAARLVGAASSVSSK